MRIISHKIWGILLQATFLLTIACGEEISHNDPQVTAKELLKEKLKKAEEKLKTDAADAKDKTIRAEEELNKTRSESRITIENDIEEIRKAQEESKKSVENYKLKLANKTKKILEEMAAHDREIKNKDIGTIFTLMESIKEIDKDKKAIQIFGKMNTNSNILQDYFAEDKIPEQTSLEKLEQKDINRIQDVLETIMAEIL